METIRLAVYGTLKEGFDKHSLLGPHAKVLAKGVRLSDYTMYNIGWGMYPGVVRDANGLGVEVEVVEAPVDVLRVIDNYEGYDEEDSNEGYNANLFVREQIELPNGETALMYLYNRDVAQDVKGYCRLVPSGRWENRSEKAFS